jgi:hypothetical protein
VFGSFQSALDECLINNYLRGDIGEFALLPLLHLLAHRFEVALHPIDTRRDAVNQRERLRVFCQHRREHTCNNVSNSGSIKGGFLQSGKLPVANAKIDDSGPRSG